MKTRGELSKIKNELEKITDIDNDFEEINKKIEIFNEYSRVKRAWRGFVNSLFEYQKKDVNRLIWQQTVDAEIFFNEDTLEKETIATKIIGYIPQFFLGLGILGTFWGLSRGLSNIDLGALSAIGLNPEEETLMSSIEVIKGSIEGLLEGIKVSFYTSVFGMLFSIITSIWMHFYFEYYESLIICVKDLINEKFSKNQEARTLYEIQMELEGIRTASNSMATDIANKLGDSFHELAQTLDTGMSKFSNDVGSSFQEAIQNKIETIFTEDLMGEFKNITQEMVNINNKNKDFLLELYIEIPEVMTKMRELTEALLDKMSSIREQLEDTSDKTYKTFSYVQELNYELLDLAKQTKAIFQDTDAFTSILSMLKRIEGLKGTLEAKSQSEEKLQMLWKNFNTVFNETNTQLSQNFINFEESINSHSESFSQMINELSNEFSHVMSDGVRKLFSDYDQNLTRAVTQFDSVLSTLGTRITELNETLDSNHDLSKKQNESIELLQENYSEHIRLLEDMIESLKQYTASIDQLQKN
jgi:hypothetical protein